MHLVDNLAGYVRKESRDVQKGAILFSSSEDGILIGWDETREYLNAMPGVHAVDGGCDNLEFNRSDATKAAGLQTLAVMLGIPMNETLSNNEDGVAVVLERIASLIRQTAHLFAVGIRCQAIFFFKTIYKMTAGRKIQK